MTAKEKILHDEIAFLRGFVDRLSRQVDVLLGVNKASTPSSEDDVKNQSREEAINNHLMQIMGTENEANQLGDKRP